MQSMIPSLLQRQLFREILRLFLLTSGALLTLLIISRAVRMRELLLGLDIGLADMLTLFAFLTPMFLLLVIPISCMLSGFLVFLRMGADRELIALKAGGISIVRMLPAPLVFALICFVATSFVSTDLIPWSMTQFRATLLDIAAHRATIEIQPGVFNRDFPGYVLFARGVDPQKGTLSDIMLSDRSNEEQSVVITAPLGEIVADHSESELRFVLSQGHIYAISSKGSSTIAFKKYVVSLPLDNVTKGISLKEIRPQEMSFDELRTLVQKARHESEAFLRNGNLKDADKRNRYANRLEAEMHQRWAYAVACFVLMLFVIPLGAAAQGLHKQVGMLLALAMFFVYYSLISLGAVLAEAGTLPVAVAVWVPNVLFFVLGAWGVRLVCVERFPDISRILRAFSEMLNRVRSRVCTKGNI